VARKLREEKFLGRAMPARRHWGEMGFSGASHISPATAKDSLSILFLKIDRERKLGKSRTCKYGGKN
jgi:hypothetical protein